MATGLMRRFSSSARTRLPPSPRTSRCAPRPPAVARHRTDARPWPTLMRPCPASTRPRWFTSSPRRAHEPDEREQQRLRERNVQLGSTIRILHESLPNLLNSPLPSDILSPHISLHLFPSTHPHLPTVRGRLAYTAALWTAPVAWGRVPVIGNVRLSILSERMVQDKSGSGRGAEKLLVKWQTCSTRGGGETASSRHVSETFERVTDIVRRGGEGEGEGEDEFTGLFVFAFDELGRVASHTIEHTEEGQVWERTARFVSVTDWLLGRAWGRREGVPGLAWVRGRR